MTKILNAFYTGVSEYPLKKVSFYKSLQNPRLKRVKHTVARSDVQSAKIWD